MTVNGDISERPSAKKRRGVFLSERYRLGLKKDLLWSALPPSQAKALKEQIADKADLGFSLFAGAIHTGRNGLEQMPLLPTQHCFAVAALIYLQCSRCRQSGHAHCIGPGI